jgi:hypothetical protein
MVRSLSAESDLVFVGRVDRVEEALIPREEADEQRVGNRFFVRADVTPIRALKGDVPGPLALTYTRDEGVIEVSCSSLRGFRYVELNTSYRYVLYVKDGTVLRASLITDWFDGLTADLEEKIIARSAEGP